MPRTNGVQKRALFKVGFEEEEAVNKDMALKAPSSSVDITGIYGILIELFPKT